MKIVVRRSVFETNSSSNHSLIITNSKNFEKDNEELNQILKEEREVVYHEPRFLKTKEDKAYILAGLFNFTQEEGFNELDTEYETFIQVLKDNNEEEILKNIVTNAKEYIEGIRGVPYCDKYFDDGPLIECNCEFVAKFRKFFNADEKFKFLYDNKMEEYNSQIYQKLYKFLYEDGMIITLDLW